MIELFIRRLDPADTRPLPQYATAGSSGMDLLAAHPAILNPGDRQIVGTGISIHLPENLEAQVRPRSGLAFRRGITVLNAPGTIDSDYRGEIGVLLVNHGRDTCIISSGERIAQLVIAPVVRVRWIETDAAAATDRGASGWGSTGS